MFKSSGNQTFGARATEVGASVACMFLWVLFFSLCLRLFANAFYGSVHGNELILGVIPNIVLHDYLRMGSREAVASGLSWVFVSACIVAPFLEEIFFRALFCGVSADRSGKLSHWGWAVILSGSFIVFGLAHRNGLYSVLVQGVIGLFLARLWFRNGPGQKASYFSCVAAHGLYNFAVITAALIF